MPTYIYVHRSPDIRLWGLTYQQRAARQFRNDSAVTWVARLEDIPAGAEQAGAKLVVVDGHWLLDGRILQTLTESEQGRYFAATAGRVVAVVTPVAQRQAAIACLEGDAQALATLRQFTLEEQISTVETRLRKIDPLVIMALTAANRRAIETALYGSAYKSVTDLITKWVWPRPARTVTGWCARLGVRPNHVTFMGVMLMLAAAWLFYRGEYGWGLLAGWIMTFLDTVDGKLARVTLTASKLGNALDHGVDLVHPPFWYVLWGMGLAHAGGWPVAVGPVGLELSTAGTLIFAGYVLGRLAEGCFEWLIASFSLFTWRPFDSFNRLVTARRNPCLILLTVGWALGRPDMGLLGVVTWTVLSTVVLWLRNLQAAFARRHGPLMSWLEQAGNGKAFAIPALRAFAPHLLSAANAPGNGGRPGASPT